jgi:hypothetical protein
LHFLHRWQLERQDDIRALRELAARASAREQPPEFTEPASDQAHAKDTKLCMHGTPFGTLKKVFERVQAEPIPDHIQKAVKSRKSAGQTSKQLLATLCMRLAERAGWEFFLSGASAGRMLGVEQQTVSKWLLEFARLKLIRRTKWGNSRSGKANCYAWTGGK